MTSGEALKDFFRKTILPVASAVLLYCMSTMEIVLNMEPSYPFSLRMRARTR